MSSPESKAEGFRVFGRAAPEMPPVTNFPLYCWRVLAKHLSFYIFGGGSVILSILLFPAMRLCLHPRARFQKHARALISFSWRGFVNIMHILGIVNLDVDDRAYYRGLSSTIVVANHPSILDVVMMISLIPNADCIVQGYLNHSILRLIVRQLYIVNDTRFHNLTASCKESLEAGYCLLIFPEGTRTRRYRPMKLQRGAAHMALQTGKTITVVSIGGTDKYGIGKHDPWFSFNHRERYVYKIRRRGVIDPADYKDLPEPAAARRITAKIEELFLSGEDVINFGDPARMETQC